MQKSMTIKELPDYERPYEECLGKGPSFCRMRNYQCDHTYRDSREIKSVDLDKPYSGMRVQLDGLLNLIYLDMDKLMKIRGIGMVKAVQLKCAGELAKRISMASRHKEIILKNPFTIASYYMERLRHEQRRKYWLLTMFDSKNMLIGEEVLSVGTSRAALISPGEISKTALLAHAEYIVLLHNHPSGNPEPSNEDVKVTLKIKKCGELLDVLLMDHIIIGDNCYFSFREQGVLFEKGRE